MTCGSHGCMYARRHLRRCMSYRILFSRNRIVYFAPALKPFGGRDTRGWYQSALFPSTPASHPQYSQIFLWHVRFTERHARSIHTVPEQSASDFGALYFFFLFSSTKVGPRAARQEEAHLGPSSNERDRLRRERSARQSQRVGVPLFVHQRPVDVFGNPAEEDFHPIQAVHHVNRREDQCQENVNKSRGN